MKSLLFDSDCYGKEVKGEVRESIHPYEVAKALSSLTGISMESSDMQVQIGTPQVNVISENTHSVSYPRYMIQCKLGREWGDGDYAHFGNVGIVVNAASNKAIAYSGYRAEACLNLCVFNGENVLESKLDTLEESKSLELAVKGLKSSIKSFNEKLDRMLSRTYSPQLFDQQLGKLLRIADKPVRNYFLDAAELLSQEENMYLDMPDSDYKLYGLLTDSIKGRNFSNSIDHSRILFDLVSNG